MSILSMVSLSTSNWIGILAFCLSSSWNMKKIVLRKQIANYIMASNSRRRSWDEVDESIEMGLFLVGFSGFSACIFPGWTSFLYEDFWKMTFWLVLKLEISYNRVIIISWRIWVSFRGFFWRFDHFCVVKCLSSHNSSFAFLRYFSM